MDISFARRVFYLALAGITVISITPSCVNTGKTYAGKPPVIKPVEKTPSVLPGLQQATDAFVVADNQTVVTSERIKNLRKQLSDAENQADTATSKLKKMTTLKQATEQELADLYEWSIDQMKKLSDMSKQLTSIEESRTEEQKLRKTATDKLLVAEEQLIVKEQETANLRVQLEVSAVIAQQASDNARDAFVEVDKAKAQAASYKGESAFKTKIIMGEAGLIILLTLFIALLIKKRTMFPF